MRATVHIRDQNRLRRGILPVLSGEAILRANQVGTWRFEVDASTADTQRTVDRLTRGCGVYVIDDDTGETVFSGPLRFRDRRAAPDSPVRTRVFEGVTDDFWLFNRMMLPDPTRADTAQNLSTAAHYKATGVTETVARGIVNTQAGPGALVARRIPGLVLEAADGLAGSTVAVQARYRPSAGEVLNELGTVGGVAWRVAQPPESTDLLFEVWAPRDLSRRARFSRDLGNVADFSYADRAPGVTDVTVLAQGDLTARTVRHRASSDPVAAEWGPILEDVLDRRDSDDNATLDNAGDEVIADLAASSQVDFAALDLPRMRFGDYKLNDLVTAELDGATITERVRQITLSFGVEGIRVRPLIGPASVRDPSEPPSVRVIRRLTRRIGRLEGAK